MRLTKYSHACVRLESGGRTLVIDPGSFSEEASLDGATDVLITHEHFDHIDPKKLAGRDLAIHAPAPVVELLAVDGVTAHTVMAGDAFEAAGYAIRAVGGEHAEIYGGYPGCPNIGYVIDENIYHPGDALFVPDLPLSTVLVPAAGPWLKIAEAIDFVRALRPLRAHPIHDATLTADGLSLVDTWISRMGETEYARIPVGESVDA